MDIEGAKIIVELLNILTKKQIKSIPKELNERISKYFGKNGITVR